MGLRLLSYMVQLWEMQRRRYEDAKLPQSKWQFYPILPLVFYTGKRRWRTPISLQAMMEVPQLLEPFVPTFRSLLLKLQEMPPERLTGSAVASALRALQAAEEPVDELATVLQQVVGYLETLPEEAQPEWRRALYFVYLLIQHKRPEPEQSRLARAIEAVVTARHRADVEEIVMTGAQALEAKGRREGRAEGRQEGRIEALRETLLKMVEQKFGPANEQVITAIQSLSEAQLQEKLDRILIAHSLAELGL
jgi:hypothetical protein